MRIGMSDSFWMQHRMASVLDKNGDDAVSADELAKLADTKAAGEGTAADLQAYLAGQDANGDGKLSRLEIAPSQMFSPDTLNAMLDELAGKHERPIHLNIADSTLVASVRKQAFAKLDTNQDGGLSLDELAPLRANVPDGDDAQGRAAMKALDQDGDGRLGLREVWGSKLFSSASLDRLMGGTQDPDQPTPPTALAGWALAQADTDGDGALSMQEYANLRTPDDPTNGIGFKRADQDRDGRLSAAELADQLDGDTGLFLRNLQVGDVKPAAIAGADADGDHALSAEELTATAGQADASAIMALDADGDGKISSAEIDAAVGDDPEFFRSGRIGVRWEGENGVALNPDAAHVALSRLLWKTLDRMTDEFAGKPATNLKA